MARDGSRTAVPAHPLTWAVIAVLAIGLAAPAGATTREDLRDARAELANITERIVQRTAELADARSALTLADARVELATGRLAAATVLRRMTMMLPVLRSTMLPPICPEGQIAGEA